MRAGGDEEGGREEVKEGGGVGRGVMRTTTLGLDDGAAEVAMNAGHAGVSCRPGCCLCACVCGVVCRNGLVKKQGRVMMVRGGDVRG